MIAASTSLEGLTDDQKKSIFVNQTIAGIVTVLASRKTHNYLVKQIPELSLPSEDDVKSLVRSRSRIRDDDAA